MAGIKISDLPAVPSAQLTDVFPVDQGATTYKESNTQLLSLFQANGQALTSANDTNVTMTLGGSPTTALLNPASMTLGWTGQLSVPRGGTGNSTFTAYSVICAGTTATGAFQNVVGVGNAGEQLTSNGPGALPTWQPSSTITPAALTRVDDTNVTLTLGGTPATALLQATSITAGWTGTLSGTRGGTGVNNGASTITLGGSLTTSGAFTSTFTMTNTTSVTFPTSGTLATTSQIPTGAALTKSDDTNVTLTLGGSPTTALVNAASITAGWTGTLSGTRGGTGVNNGASTATYAGNLNFASSFTTSGAFAVTQTYTGITNVTFPTSGTLATTSQLPTPAALTRVNDTNVTLTLGGTPATALLQAASLTLGWTGTLAETRGGTAQSTYTTGDILYSSASNTLSKLAGNITTAKQYLSQTGNGSVSAAPAWATIAGADITGAALTKVDDTNVTLTLGGTPTTALLRASSLTLGWTGQLGLTRGGTAASLTASNGGVVYSTSSAMAILSGTATAGQIIRSGASAAPTWSTTTYPATNAINTLLYASSANVMSALATANNGILVTSSGGVPSIANTVGAGLTMPSITFNTTSGVIGTTTNDNAAAGSVGEYVSGVNSSGTALTTNTNVNVTSISLTAGDWDVSGSVFYLPNGTTNITFLGGGISTTSVTLPAIPLYGALSLTAAGQVSSNYMSIPIPNQRLSLSGTTTVYLVAQGSFTISTLTVYGTLQARRRR